MSRPRRKCARNYVPEVSASHYLGYVEDFETPEMIMKKFEVMEQMTQGFVQEQVVNDKSKGKEKIDTSKPPEEDAKLSEAQLNDMFKMTSHFSVESINSQRTSYAVLEDEEELFLECFTPGDDDEYFEEDEVWEEDDASDFEFSEANNKRRKNNNSNNKPKKKRGDSSNKHGNNKKQSGNVQRRRRTIVPYEVTGADGFVYTVKKKARAVDPNVPEYQRMPPLPLPETWAKIIKPLLRPEEPHPSSIYIETNDILSYELHKFGTFQGILMDPPWLLPGQDPIPGTITVDDFAKLRIDEKLIPRGLIFIWVEKELIAPVVKTLDRWGFTYVENLVWVKLSVNNKFVCEPYKYFQKSKVSLLIFRKVIQEGSDMLELRHQRNSDVLFDFLREQTGLTEDKPQAIYSAIETLLPTANYSEETGRGEFLELWGRKGNKRKGWTTLVHQM